MLNDWSRLWAPAVQDRITLLLNHVISRESHAMARLQPQAGKSVLVHLRGWPGLLPAAPDLALQVTPAGLWERLDAAPADALRIEIDAANPAALAFGALTGAKPDVQIQGDAAFAAEMNWLMENLRWDLEDELAQLVGPAPAHQLARWGGAIAQAFGKFAKFADGARNAAMSGGRGPA
ncbi:hypothetical protein PFX98_14125 [Paucibacter sediminis]|uniref:Ubiquinone biosynthesis protein UbiJ n=1 Tax=Paucibacter sediminis TaxID=3019553 RepID=A0AA95SJK1_9BURK|nr:hypothetical protein [Paucibacter sp. S2-9]WIT10073.1 hypothetical protein PFX98_14125 [Paucibacter sp. S2-9]